MAVLASAGIVLHLALRFWLKTPAAVFLAPLWAVIAAGGPPLVAGIARRLLARELGADALAALAICVSVAMGECLVAAILVLMLSGGVALEQIATQRASSILKALADRAPRAAHRKRDSSIQDSRLDEVAVGDLLVVFPHEICPVDGVVVEGQGTMDESYLTGEPYEMSKAPGSQVLSGAINGDSALTIEARKAAVDSRYAKIVEVLRAAERVRPRLRRLADALAAWYVPAALALAAGAWAWSGDSGRFLAVLAVATPCPLLIAIPVAVIGAISLGAKRGIIIKNPAALEQIINCRTVIFDKTGTLTYGKPALTEVLCAKGRDRESVLSLAASLERYSKHPLASAIVRAAAEARVETVPAGRISERPGKGLEGTVAGREVRVMGRASVAQAGPEAPGAAPGLECLVFIDGEYAATLRFHDAPRRESGPFLRHLFPFHRVERVALVSGDRPSGVGRLAQALGIAEVHAGKSPEEKASIVAEATRRGMTLFVGDGINDAPALMAATVGVAFGSNSDVVSEAADAVVMTPAIGKVDELIHIGRRMRAVALQSAIGGMALSVAGMLAAACGLLPPVQGVIAQEIIDLAAVANALRATVPPRRLTDF